MHVVIRPPPPQHGQNPYEVLTSSQLHPESSLHDETKVQMQWQHPHSVGKHFGPVYDIRDPEHGGRPGNPGFTNPEYRSCKNKKCKKKKAVGKANKGSVFDLISNKVVSQHSQRDDGSKRITKKIKSLLNKAKSGDQKASKPKHVISHLHKKTFMNPYPNPYKQHTMGMLGNLVPQVTSQKNKSLESNTNNFELGDQRHYQTLGKLNPPPKFGNHDEEEMKDDAKENCEDEGCYKKNSLKNKSNETKIQAASLANNSRKLAGVKSNAKGPLRRADPHTNSGPRFPIFKQKKNVTIQVFRKHPGKFLFLRKSIFHERFLKN